MPGEGDTPNFHDMLTGSQPDGRAFTDAADHTCRNWTSGDDGSAWVGHHDRTSTGTGTSWNAIHGNRQRLQSGAPETQRRRGALLLFLRLMREVIVRDKAAT